MGEVWVEVFLSGGWTLAPRRKKVENLIWKFFISLCVAHLKD